MGREDKIEKDFSEYLDRMLASEEVVISDEMNDDLKAALEFARRMIKFSDEPSASFAENLKRDLLRKLAEQQALAKEKQPGFWGFISSLSPRSTAWRVVSTAAVVIMISRYRR